MELKQLCSIIESILFVRGEEVHYDEVVKIIREGNPECVITKKNGGRGSGAVAREV